MTKIDNILNIIDIAIIDLEREAVQFRANGDYAVFHDYVSDLNIFKIISYDTRRYFKGEDPSMEDIVTYLGEHHDMIYVKKIIETYKMYSKGE